MVLLNDLIKYKVITDNFEYSELDLELRKKYQYFDSIFQILLKEKAEIFNLKDCVFYIQNNIRCNAFANNPKYFKGYNIIGITHGYAAQMYDMFEVIHFKKMIDNGLLKTDESLNESYIKIKNNNNGIELYQFMLDCSTHFTFGHEFQHLLQFNSNSIKKQLHFSENLTNSKFQKQKHLWEFDADRFGSYEVLRFIHLTYQSSKIKDNKILKLLLILGLGSLFIAKILFYLNLVDLNSSPKFEEFYTNKKSHPHPLVRIINITEYYHENIQNSYPLLNIQLQELLNMSLWIVNIYLNSTIPNQSLTEGIFENLELHLNEINLYNQELYDDAIRDEAIKKLLISRGINFDTEKYNA